MAFRDERTLSVKQIKATVERFETQCETIRTNAEQDRSSYDGQRYPKVVTPLKFERVPLVDSDFVESHVYTPLCGFQRMKLI